MRILYVSGLDPIYSAHLQALYSRTSKSMFNIIKEEMEINQIGEDIYTGRPKGLNEEHYKKAEEFLQKWYVGYGDESIADCGVVNLFIEGVSLPLAKFIQHDPLYSGIEVSTRYIDMGQGGVEGLAWQTDETIDDLERYKKVYSDMIDYANMKIESREWDKYPEGSVKAWAFDIARGFLPLNTTTNLSATISIRTLRELIYRTRHVRDTNYLTREQLDASEKFVTDVEYLGDRLYELFNNTYPSMEWDKDKPKYNPPEIKHMVAHVPVRVTFNAYGTINGVLDYGGWRDVARHRTLDPVFSLPVEGSDMHPYYTDMSGVGAPRMASNDVYENLLGHLVRYRAKPFGDRFIEHFNRLRSGSSVHPTVRMFQGAISYKEALETRPYMRRADQTIRKK